MIFDLYKSMRHTRRFTFSVNKQIQGITNLVIAHASALSFVDGELQKSNNMNRSEQLHRITSQTTLKKVQKNNVDYVSQIKVSFVGST